VPWASSPRRRWRRGWLRPLAWPVNRELELFSDGFAADVEKRSALPRDGVFSMMLSAVASVLYMVSPERGRDDGLGGVVTLEWIAAGRYQITLSGDAWVDAVQTIGVCQCWLPAVATTARAFARACSSRSRACRLPAVRRRRGPPPQRRGVAGP